MFVAVGGAALKQCPGIGMFERIKECTGSFSCRFRTALLFAVLVVTIAVAIVILVVE